MDSIMSFISSAWVVASSAPSLSPFYTTNHHQNHGINNTTKPSSSSSPSSSLPLSLPPTPPPPTETRPSRWTLVESLPEMYDLSISGSTTLITLSRPSQGNSLTLPMMRSLTSTFSTLSTDPSVHRIVITGSGRYFCTGMDLKEDSSCSSSSSSSSSKDRFTILHSLFQTIDTCPKPTVALINGPAFGGGVGLATVCDVRLVPSPRTTFFSLSEVKLGLCPATISKYLVREWGVSLARMAMITGRKVRPEVLYRAGVIHCLGRNRDDDDDDDDDEEEEEEEEELLLEEFLGDMRYVAPGAAGLTKMLAIKAAERGGGGEKGGEEEIDRVAGDVFERMMRRGGEGEYGIEMFRKGERGVVWEDVKIPLGEREGMENGRGPPPPPAAGSILDG